MFLEKLYAMKSIFSLTWILLFNLSFFFSCDDSPKRETLELKPGSADGIDAQIFSGDPDGNEDLGIDRRDLVASVWIISSVPESKYSLIDFDLSSIETDAKIIDAKLKLFHDDGSFDDGHSLQSGSNELLIQRIISQWDESVTWNLRPVTTTQNQVSVPSSTSETQNYHY